MKITKSQFKHMVIENVDIVKEALEEANRGGRVKEKRDGYIS